MDSAEELQRIAQEVVNCTACGLHFTRKKAVPGEGPADSDLMFIGEAPGFHENEQGRPFVGAAGKFMESMLEGIGLSREQVFIGNVIKCRPPRNRDPQPDEIQACLPFLERQIQAINPKVIVTLGRFSMRRYFPNAKISEIHGQAKFINGRMVVPMYHPAAALHQPALRGVIGEDFKRLPEWIAKAKSGLPSERTEPEEPQQMSMF